MSYLTLCFHSQFLSGYRRFSTAQSKQEPAQSGTSGIQYIFFENEDVSMKILDYLTSLQMEAVEIIFLYMLPNVRIFFIYTSSDELLVNILDAVMF